jgi:hypothetical protein
MVMRAFYILSFLICLTVWVSCKNDASVQKEANTSETPNYSNDTLNPPKMETSSEAPTSQAGEKKAAGTGTAQANVNQGHDYTFLTFKMFKINGAFVPGKDPKDQPIKINGSTLLPTVNSNGSRGKNSYFQGIGDIITMCVSSISCLMTKTISLRNGTSSSMMIWLYLPVQRLLRMQESNCS